MDRRFQIGHGRVFALYVAGYCLGRFWIEMMRTTTPPSSPASGSTSFTSIIVFLGAVAYFVLAKKGRESPEDLQPRHPHEPVAAGSAGKSAPAGAESAKVAPGDAKPAGNSGHDPAS